VAQTPIITTNEINTFVTREVRPTAIDQRYQSKALFGILRSKKRIIIEDGGSVIAQPILAQPNQTAITYQGADVLPTDAQEEFTSYEVPWKQAQVSITIIGLDKLRASGKRATLNLVKDKTESAYMAIFDLLGKQLYGNGQGNGGKDWDGLGASINNAPGFQNYLNIDRVANPWWQAQVFDPGTATPLATPSMMTLWMACKTDEERVHLIAATKTGYGTFQGLLTPQEWFIDQEIGNLGFQNLAFQGSPMVDDSGVPTGSMYFINLDHVRIFLHKDDNFRFSGFDSPINQNIDTAHIYVTGNCENRKPAASGVYRSGSNI
jgi:hypothetical protein